MTHQARPRHYVSPFLVTVMRPLLRRSDARDAYVLRVVGRHHGPVIRYDRRRGHAPYDGVERRSG